MTKVFKYYAIRCSTQMGKTTYAVFGYDNPRDPASPEHVEDFFSEEAARAAYPAAVREDLFTKPWPTENGLAPAEDE
jgi:hypothetical protein